MFSKACEYAIRATVYVALKTMNGKKLGIQEIAKEIDSPVPFTAKILQNLAREGIISSAKGPNGGFYLDAAAKPIPLKRIVKAIDGEEVLYMCSLGLRECSDQFPCPIHHEVKAYKDRLKVILAERTVQQLTEELARGKTFLKIERQ